MRWSGINIEAHPGIFKELEKNRPLSININKALTGPEEEGKTLKFNAYDFPTDVEVIIKKFGPHAPVGFLDSAIKHRDNISTGRLKNMGQIQVVGTTYKTIIENYKIEKVDLFVLDVEGSELEVIKGMKGCDILPEVLCIEVNKTNKVEMNLLLKEMGYSFYSNVHVNSRYVRRK